eukprot:365161-Chlamydomonas_euryale.AAC.8
MPTCWDSQPGLAAVQTAPTMTTSTTVTHRLLLQPPRPPPQKQRQQQQQQGPRRRRRQQRFPTPPHLTPPERPQNVHLSHPPGLQQLTRHARRQSWRRRHSRPPPDRCAAASARPSPRALCSLPGPATGRPLRAPAHRAAQRRRSAALTSPSPPPPRLLLLLRRRHPQRRRPWSLGLLGCRSIAAIAEPMPRAHARSGRRRRPRRRRCRCWCGAEGLQAQTRQGLRRGPWLPQARHTSLPWGCYPGHPGPPLLRQPQPHALQRRVRRVLCRPPTARARTSPARVQPLVPPPRDGHAVTMAGPLVPPLLHGHAVRREQQALGGAARPPGKHGQSPCLWQGAADPALCAVDPCADGLLHCGEVDFGVRGRGGCAGAGLRSDWCGRGAGADAG